MLAGVGGDGESMCLCVLYVFVDGRAEEKKNDFPEDALKNPALSGEQIPGTTCVRTPLWFRIKVF